MRRRILNFIAGVVLVLLLVLRRWFREAIDELPNVDPAHKRRMRILLGPAAIVFTVFAVVGIWALLDAGYWVVALVLLAQVGILLDAAWRKQD